MTAASGLLGRATEIEYVTRLLDDVHERGATLVVHGEPGIGKSALLTVAAEHAREHGMRVLATAGVQSEARLPFAGLHRILRPVLGGIDELSGAEAEALRAAFGQRDAAGTELFRIALAVLDLLANAAAVAPVLVVAEDAHWLDRSTVDVMSFVARRVETDPIVLMAAIRDGFENVPAELGLPDLRLRGLDDAAARALLDTHAQGLDPALRERLLQTAAGNPLALVELPRAWRESGTGSVLPAWLPLTERLERAFVARTAGMAPATLTVLLVSALDEEGVLSDVLRACELLTGGRVGVEAFAPAVSAGLIEVDQGHVRFRHPLVRSAIYQAAVVDRRHSAHAALADVLADSPDRSAWHRAASTIGPSDDVAAELEAMADRAQRRGGVSVSVAALERAAQFAESPVRRSELLLRGAELGFELGRHDVLDQLLERVAGLDIGSRQQAHLHWLRGVFDEGLGGGASRIGPMVTTAATVAQDGAPDLALKLLWSAALQCWFSDPGDESRAEIVAVERQVPGDEDDPRRLAIRAFAAPVESGHEVMQRLPRLAVAAAHDPGAARVVGTAATAVGAFDLAERLLATSATGLRTQGRLGLLARALTLQAWSAAHRVDLSVGIPVAVEAERLARETAQPLIVAVAQATHAMLAGLRGEAARADALAAAAEGVALPIDAHAVLAAVQHARGLAALGAGRHAEAFDHLSRLHEPSDPSYHYFMRCFSIADLAEAASYGDQAAAAVVLADMEALALRTPSPLLHAGLAYARAVLADDDDDEPRFDAALSATAAWPFLRARTQLAHGMWLRRHRHLAESRAPLRAAIDALEALGAIPWAERARRELRASGETSRRRTPDARDELSPQELQIAHMAAEGLTNREIGQRLFLSHRTISSHLYRIFPKLGITSRAELAKALPEAAAADAQASPVI